LSATSRMPSARSRSRRQLDLKYPRTARAAVCKPSPSAAFYRPTMEFTMTISPYSSRRLLPQPERRSTIAAAAPPSFRPATSVASSSWSATPETKATIRRGRPTVSAGRRPPWPIGPIGSATDGTAPRSYGPWTPKPLATVKSASGRSRPATNCRAGGRADGLAKAKARWQRGCEALSQLVPAILAPESRLGDKLGFTNSLQGTRRAWNISEFR
jgi:hypothetical protein